jgi:small subunit ribosomal protein S18
MAEEFKPQAPAETPAPAATPAPSGAPPASPSLTGAQGSAPGSPAGGTTGGGAPSSGGMGHGRPPSSGPRPPAGAAARRTKRTFTRKKKVCRFCVDKIDFIDYKKADLLASFIRDRGKILPRRITGTCARHQRWVTVAIKRARNIALLPFSTEI